MRAILGALGVVGMLIPTILVIAVLTIGTLASQYDIAVLFHTHLNLFLSFIVSLVTGELSIIVAVFLKVLALFGLIAA